MVEVVEVVVVEVVLVVVVGPSEGTLNTCILGCSLARNMRPDLGHISRSLKSAVASMLV